MEKTRSQRSLQSRARRAAMKRLERAEIVSSFLAANVEHSEFGSLKIPSSFIDTMTEEIPATLRLVCYNLKWRGRYDCVQKRINGLRRFMEYYGVKMFCVVQFDYYGGGVFHVKVMKETAIECMYPTDHPDYCKRKLMQSERDQYLIDYDKLEYEKRIALITFNAFRNNFDYGQMQIVYLHMHPEIRKMPLDPSLERFYRGWVNGTSVSLRFIQKEWKIKVEWINGQCTFGEGWLQFARDAELEMLDELLMYKLSPDSGVVNVCIFKNKDYVRDQGEGGFFIDRSFFKIISNCILKNGALVVPRLVKKGYSDKLKNTKQMKVGGEFWPVRYNSEKGVLLGLKDLIERFRLVENDTIWFTIDDSNILSGKIYQGDGMEVNYSNRIQNFEMDLSGEWYWTMGSQSDSDTEDEDLPNSPPHEPAPVAANLDVIIPTFSAKMHGSNVDNTSHGVHIPKTVKPQNRDWIKGEKLPLRTTAGSWDCGLVISNSLARFSAGWNLFARQNELAVNDILEFRLIEDENGLAFEVSKFPHVP